MPRADASSLLPQVTGLQQADLLVAWGPTLQVVVGHLKFDAGTQTAGIAQDRASETVLALVDTGAAQSCIDDELAKRLGLSVIDKEQCSGVGGPTIHDVYLAFVHIPGLVFAQYGRFMGVHLQAGGQIHQALLGRSFLQGASLVYDGHTGHVTIWR